MNNSPKESNTVKKQKKIIILIMSGLALFVALYYIITLVDFSGIFGDDEENPGGNYDLFFYDESLSYNIFDDEKYGWWMKLSKSLRK